MQALLVTFSDSTNSEKTEVKKERKKKNERKMLDWILAEKMLQSCELFTLTEDNK